MRCIAHIWNSLDCDGNQLLLCISPLDSVAGGAPVEAFTNEKSLARRLRDIGVDSDFINEKLSSLRDHEEMTWATIEVSLNAFESFGHTASRSQ
jgi:hypothetical protein